MTAKRREGGAPRRYSAARRASASRCSTTTVRSGPNSRFISRSCSPSTGSRCWRRDIRNGRTRNRSPRFSREISGRRCQGRARNRRNRPRHLFRDDHRRNPADRHGLARHRAASETQQPFTEMVYRPMLELLAFVRTASRPSSFRAAASSSCECRHEKRLEEDLRLREVRGILGIGDVFEVEFQWEKILFDRDWDAAR